MEAMSFGEAFNTAIDVQGKTVYSCKLCGRPFHNYSNLKRHIKLHDPIQESFPCTLCRRKYGRKDTLKCHLRQAHGLTSLPADGCDSGYQQSIPNHSEADSAKNYLRDFTRPGHRTNFSVLMAAFCLQPFPHTIVNNMRVTLIYESRTKERRRCPKCRVLFSTRGTMLRHLSLHSPQHAPKYQCDVCFKLLSRKHYLKVHRKVKHGVDFEL
ncbi:unnamed protein product [Ixodes hexagonus]